MRSLRGLLYISPLIIVAVTVAIVAGLGALGAECSGDFMDGPRTCNTAGTARETIGWGGFIVGSAGFVGIALAIAAEAVWRSLRGGR
jgi:hypothetical protein